MTPEFAIAQVAVDVVAHLERHREAAARDEAATAREVETALAPIRAAYRESELPRAYFDALEAELRAALPAAWRAAAVPFTALEARGFGRWRGGDLTARLAYVLGGLTLGGLIVWLPFIPIWEKWVPFALAVGGWWLPDAQVAWHRRRYGRELGRIIGRFAASQPALEARVPMNELLPPPGGAP
ncbi:MAG TPA: hypothetical protein VK989_01095 [Polyangia bacterium]|nr:hypothetical protein [Polyangia bacterium]